MPIKLLTFKINLYYCIYISSICENVRSNFSLANSYNRTPVIMASGRELCYVLLVGILSCYGMSFVILAKPDSWNCSYLRIGLGLCLSTCYSAILTKTNRISRIFNTGNIKGIQRPSYTSPKSQVAIALGECSVLLKCSLITWHQ